ncbi:SDR family oxidoreductase [Bordetella genomosp. 13]|uniref:SDR family oxidoreductase n=1 Tax=Bordetella genomosp. 13 TaxID=463040 RepID=UPI0011A21641|nr:SDR family oxidoreductase [Bordetella genomosp. 13]
MASKQGPHSHTEPAAEAQRKIQREQDARDAANSGGKGGDSSPPSGGRPTPPLPAQHLEKPGVEADLQEAPQFMAPDYRGSGKLAGKVALITGGDSGIGRAVAVLYAREGADVAIVYLNEDIDAKETAGYVEEEGQRCLLIPGDVRDPAFCREAVERTVKELGKLDILVNNAAFQEHAESLLDLTDERLDQTFQTNIRGYIQMARAALPHLSIGSSIINTGSVTGLRGSAQLLDYSSTKGAIHAFTWSLAANLAPHGIRVNAVAPGPVWTPLNPADRPPEGVEKFGEQTVMGRPAQPEELSPAYVFLASHACASYITGLVLPITGSPGF